MQHAAPAVLMHALTTPASQTCTGQLWPARSTLLLSTCCSWQPQQQLAVKLLPQLRSSCQTALHNRLRHPCWRCRSHAAGHAARRSTAAPLLQAWRCALRPQWARGLAPPPAPLGWWLVLPGQRGWRWWAGWAPAPAAPANARAGGTLHWQGAVSKPPYLDHQTPWRWCSRAPGSLTLPAC